MNEFMAKIEFYSKVYEFSFQFWGKHNNNVFINKGGVELTSFGGDVSARSSIRRAIEYVERINPTIAKEYNSQP